MIQKPPGPGDVFQMGLSSSDDVQYDDNRQRINVTMKGRPRAILAWADFVQVGRIDEGLVAGKLMVTTSAPDVSVTSMHCS